MPNSEISFVTPEFLSGNWSDYLLLAVIALLAALSMLFFREQPLHDPNVHSPRLAWLRAGMYFCCAFIIGSLTGVFGAAISLPVATSTQLDSGLWMAMSLLCIATVIWGYVYWWPKGTLTHGRPAHPVSSAAFGIFWGLSAGQLQLSLFAILEEFGFGRIATGVLVYFLFAILNLNLQSGWWDIRISPPHNIRAWNTKKVLLAHNPFLIATLAHFVMFGNVAIYIAFQCAALACASMAMRFPPFWAPDGTTNVSRETAIGV